MKNNDLFLSYSKKFTNQPEEDSINQKVAKIFVGLNFNDWPTLIDFETQQYYSKVSIEIFNLIKRIPAIFNFDINKIQDYYQLPLIDIEKAMEGLNENNINHIIGRGDFILDKNNELKCVEFNIGCSLGGWQIDFVEELYLESSFISSLIKTSNLEVVPNKFFCTLFDYLSTLKNDTIIYDQPNCTNIAFVHLFFKDANQANILKIQDIYREWALEKNEKGDLVFCSLDDIKYENGRYKFNDTIIHCILDLQNGNSGNFNRDEVNIVSGPIITVLDNKLSMAVLSENEDSSLFTNEEKDIIKRNIPWTRKLNNEMMDFHGKKIRTNEFVLKNKDLFVLKPIYGLGGEQVCIGHKVSEAEWQEKVDLYEKNGAFIVQEYIKPQENVYYSKISGYDYFETILGLFVFGNLYGGGFTRSLRVNSKEGIINSSNGAEEGILLVVK